MATLTSSKHITVGNKRLPRTGDYAAYICGLKDVDAPDANLAAKVCLINDVAISAGNHKCEYVG